MLDAFERYSGTLSCALTWIMWQGIICFNDLLGVLLISIVIMRSNLAYLPSNTNTKQIAKAMLACGNLLAEIGVSSPTNEEQKTEVRMLKVMILHILLNF